MRSGSLRDAVFAAVCLSWVWASYYIRFMFCALLVAFFFFARERPLGFSITKRPQRGWITAAGRAMEIIGIAALGVYFLLG